MQPRFYIQVGRPSLCNLTTTFSEYYSGVNLTCTSIIPKFDRRNSEVNRLLHFSNSTSDNYTLSKISVHLHHSTRLIQIQGSSFMPDRSRAPVWFTNNILKNILKNLARDKSIDIKCFNDALKQMAPKKNVTETQQPVFKCARCEKTFQTERILKGHICSHQVQIVSVPNSSSQPDSELLSVASCSTPSNVSLPSSGSSSLQCSANASNSDKTIPVQAPLALVDRSGPAVTTPTPQTCAGCKVKFSGKSVPTLCQKCNNTLHKTSCLRDHICQVTDSSLIPSPSPLPDMSSLNPSAPPFQLPRSQQHPTSIKKGNQTPSLTTQEAEIKLLKQELTIAKTKVIEIEQENQEFSRKLKILSETLNIFEKEPNQSLRAKYFPSSRVNADPSCAPNHASYPDTHDPGLDTSTLNRVINHLLDTIDMSRSCQNKPSNCVCIGAVNSSTSQSTSTLPGTSSPPAPVGSDTCLSQNYNSKAS